MRTKTKPGRSKARSGVKAPSTAKAARKPSKLDEIVKLLRRKNGCTAKDVLAATGWPSVSMPQQAKAAGLRLRKERGEDGLTRYFAA